VELAEGETTVKELLHRLADKGGEKMKSLLFEKGADAVLPGLMVMVNNETFTGTALNQRDVPLRDRDKVSLLYFVSGG
jgi:sulfur carrier protein ThiS